MDCLTLLSNAFSAGAGAFAGALAAYFLACRQDKRRAIADYVTLLLLIYEHLDAVYKLLSNIPTDSVKEVNGEKVVVFTMPFPQFALTPQQLQTLMEVSPDKQMPAALIQFKNFLTVHSQRIAKDGVNLLPLEYVRLQERQLKFMLLSVRVQYEQQTNDAFPLE
ncbi:MAG: hypothetical protein IJU91_08705 [Selenomonadaceae bacterium]|nr:hypothetical protein [Selenomonadaceae bacterium]